jgi:hypothetical protein
VRWTALGEVGTRAIVGASVGAHTGAELYWPSRHEAVFAVEERLADGWYLSQVFESPKARRKGLPGGPLRIIEYALDDLGRRLAKEWDRSATTRA